MNIKFRSTHVSMRGCTSHPLGGSSKQFREEFGTWSRKTFQFARAGSGSVMAGRGRLWTAVSRVRVVREIRGYFSSWTKTFLERDVGGSRLRHFCLQHLPVRAAERPLAVPARMKITLKFSSRFQRLYCRGTRSSKLNWEIINKVGFTHIW